MKDDWEAICEWGNLVSAFQKAAKGKRGRAEVASYEWDFETRLGDLRESLVTNAYRPAGYRTFVVHEAKRRLISAASFQDRIVHHALMNVIADRFERSFVCGSHANRIGHGTHRALREAQAFARRFRWVLPVDLQQFFPAIDHGLLKEMLWKKVSCVKTRELIAAILQSGEGVLADEYSMRWFPGDDLFAFTRPRGLPIGNLTSQSWANVYLSPLDHFMKRELRAPGYVRYVDDILVFGDCLPTLHEWQTRIEERLIQFRMTPHPGAHPRPVTEGIPFLGFITYPDRRRIKNRKAWHFQRKFDRLTRAARNGEVAWNEVGEVVRGWVNHASFGDTWHLRESIFGDRRQR